MTDLEAVQAEFATISGVDDTDIIEVNGETYLQVHWFGSPADYSTVVSQIRDKYPELVQVEKPDGARGRTEYAMPISYYQFK